MTTEKSWSAVVPGVMLLASAVLLALASVLPMGVQGPGTPGADVVWMSRTSAMAEPVVVVVVLVWFTVGALAAVGVALLLATATWVRVLARVLAVVPLLVQAAAVLQWWRAWTAGTAQVATDATLGLGFWAVLLSSVLAVAGVLAPARRVFATGPAQGRPWAVNPADMGSSPPGWYDVHGRQHYWDGTDWTTYVTPR